MKKPKVSVIMAVYNGEKYLKECIDSILNQTFSDFEFIIINDGSTDKTEEILQDFKDERIRIVNNKENLGLTKSLNIGLSISKGKYIARIDVDDIALPQRLEKQVKFLDENQDVGLVGTWFYVIDEEGKIIGKEKYPINDAEIRKVLLKGNPFFSSSVMFRKECIEKAGKFREEFIRAQDYDLWLRISEKYKVANIPEFLCMRRYHPDAITVIKKREQEKFGKLAQILAEERRLYGKDSLEIPEKREKILKLIESFGNSEKNPRKQLSQIYKGYGLGKLILGEKESARYSFKKAIENNPFNFKLYIYLILSYFPCRFIRLIRKIKKWKKSVT
ncbi:MAG: hypothetical protein DRP67_02325 [Candidatus Omnitrophota bacterium]|nr:MAG: hypothetical protein DRP67_02325 [Candidatus Omnitrophota bacterium]